MDGMLIPVCVLKDCKIAYSSRTGIPSQNVLAICEFDMNFTFVYVDWKGSTNDEQVLRDAIQTDAIFSLPSTNKYYLVDTWYANAPGFLAPYMNHLDLLSKSPQGRRTGSATAKLFNRRHSSLRNVIERCFGVLKERFRILRGIPSFPLAK